MKEEKTVNNTTDRHNNASSHKGLSKLEVMVNSIASRLVAKADKAAGRFFENSFFTFIKNFSSLWYHGCVKIEDQRKKSNIVRKYLNRCDSLVKKVLFIFSVMLEPVKKIGVVVTVVACAVFIVNASSYDVVLGVYTNGNLVGYLETRAPMSSAQSTLESDISAIVGADYSLDCDVDYSFINVKNPVLLNDADCYRILYNIASSDIVNAYALYVDGKIIAASNDFDTLNRLVRQLTANGDLKNDIKISNQLCLKSSVMSDEKIAEMLKVSLLEEKTVTQSESGVNRVEVVEKTGEQKELDTLNAGITRFSGGKNALSLSHTLADGTKITTDKNELLSELDLVYVKTETIVEPIPYETTYEESNDYYEGTKMLKITGREGSAEVVYEIEYNKDGELSRTEVSRNIIKEPVTEVMVVGTSPAPTKNPTGNFIWPTAVPKGISSYYGSRTLFGNYDFHLGVDILNSYGNDIWAADSGTVTYTGYNNSYGYHVIIQHADGYSTLYAHMSKIYTQNGAELKQGDVIGAIGKTGVATAYHLHFEIRIDGKTVNPIDYLPEN